MKIKNILTSLLACAVLVGATSASVMADTAVEEATLAAETVTLNADVTVKEDGASALEILADTTIVVPEGVSVTLTGAKGGAGIYVAKGATLTITGEGTLTAIGNAGADTLDSGAAGIGGTAANMDCGNIVIDGATVIAKGYGIHGSGIGGVSGEIEIKNGANVTAYGGYYADGAGTTFSDSYGKGEPEGGAAIGGGAKTASVIGDIVITDSTVTAYGGSKAAGIGCTFWSSCNNIKITNSKITAQGGGSSAGIGTSRAGDNGVFAKITITNSEVDATGGKYGAGIGAGYNGDSVALPTTTIAISDSKITAVGGEAGAGIGGGYKSNNFDIDIVGDSVVTVVAGVHSEKSKPEENCACGIGSGANGSGTFNGSDITIAEDVTVNATTNGGKPAVELMNGTTLNAVNGDVNITYTGNTEFVAKVGVYKFLSFTEAVAVALDGDTVELLDDVDAAEATISKDITLDLGGNTVTDAYIIATGEVTIKNGKIVNTEESYPLVVQNGGVLTIDGVSIEASKSDRAIWVRSGSKLIFNSGSILSTKGANNTKTSLIAAIYTDSNTDVTINGGTITVDTPDNKAVGIYGNYDNANVTVNGGKISTSGKNYSYGINVDGDITVTGGEIVTNEKGYGYSSGIRYGNNYALVTALGNVTVSGGKITTNSYSGYAVNVGRTYSSNDQTVAITGGEFVNDLSEVEKTTGGHKAPVLIWEGSASKVTATIDGGTFTGFSTALLRGENTELKIKRGSFDFNPSLQNPCYVSEDSTSLSAVNGRFEVVAYEDYESSEIKVVFEEVETTVPGEKLYDIVLTADDIINRLNSADLTFNLEGKAMAYEVIASNSEIAVNPVNNDENRYEFHYDGKTGVVTDTATRVVIGRVWVTGYGTFTLSVADAATNAVHPTTLNDSIVTDFIPNGAASGKGNLTYGTPVTDTIYVPTQALTINIDFPNEIDDNAAAYQAMTVKVTGTDIDTITIALGKDTEKTDLVLANRKGAYYDVDFVDGAYVVEIVNALKANTSYTVQVSGAGYRTARYTVNTQNADKVLSFWNNVKDNAIEVEEGIESSAKTVTFLAGDIVRDNNINIYDLSAVVSYFAYETDTEKASDYAKYDLNRDGVIDSKDVAYVLVSWDK